MINIKNSNSINFNSIKLVDSIWKKKLISRFNRSFNSNENGWFNDVTMVSDVTTVTVMNHSSPETEVKQSVTQCNQLINIINSWIMYRAMRTNGSWWMQWRKDRRSPTAASDWSTDPVRCPEDCRSSICINGVPSAPIPESQFSSIPF